MVLETQYSNPLSTNRNNSSKDKGGLIDTSRIKTIRSELKSILLPPSLIVLI